MRKLNRVLLVLFLSVLPVLADEPIMNMMPRWDHGWGLQFVEEYRHEGDLLLGSEKSYSGFTEDVHLLHLQGVYTWDRSIRLTAMLPYVLDARREMPNGLGGKLVERDNGIGDATLALPLKKYFNLDGRSGSWTFKPMLRVPLAGDDDYEIYDNEWGGGLGLGYEFEMSDFAFSSSAAAWSFGGMIHLKSISQSILAIIFSQPERTALCFGRVIFTMRMMTRKPYWQVRLFTGTSTTLHMLD